MTYQKKMAPVQILREVAISDKHLDKNEMNLILLAFVNIGPGEELD